MANATATASIDQETFEEILALEREFWDAMAAKDADVATRLTADQSIVTGAQGVGVISKKDMGAMLKSGAWELKRYEFANIKVIRPDENTAVIGYSVKEELVVEGKPLTLEANDSSLWVRRGGTWQCALHTEAVKGDPFGRDRVR